MEIAKPYEGYTVQHNDIPADGDAKALRQWATSAYLDLQHVTTFFGEALDAAEQILQVGLGHDKEIRVVVNRSGADALRTPGLQATIALHLHPVPEELGDFDWTASNARSMLYGVTNLAAIFSRAFEGANVQLWGHTVPATGRDMMLRLRVPDEWK